MVLTRCNGLRGRFLIGNGWAYGGGTTVEVVFGMALKTMAKCRAVWKGQVLSSNLSTSVKIGRY